MSMAELKETKAILREALRGAKDIIITEIDRPVHREASEDGPWWEWRPGGWVTINLKMLIPPKPRRAKRRSAKDE